MKKKYFIFISFFLIQICFASPCMWTITRKFINADLVVKVKIVKSFPDMSYDVNYQSCFVEAEVIETYKGITLTDKIKINYFCFSGGDLYLPVDTEWLIFAYFENNQYLTHSCSGTTQTTPLYLYDEDMYPSYNEHLKYNIKEMTSLLENLKLNKVNISNKFYLQNTYGYYDFFKNANNLKFKNKYAFYKIIFNSDLSIKEIKTIQGYSIKFDNDLKKEIIKKNHWIEVLHSLKEIPQNTEWLIIIKQNEKLDQTNQRFTEIIYDL